MSGRRHWIGRRGGCAHSITDPLGWRAHGGAFPFVWFARKFRVGSRLNYLGYRGADYVVNRRVKKIMARSHFPA